ncbi:MAG: hypothetical protein HRT94_08810 [Alphaproteobacteria bacterium]|nr:hypothetical protein [Alphaproteobacteria bacterium]
MMDHIEDETQFITPPNMLKQKMGSGGIPEEVLKRSQEFIDNNNIDYEPYAQDYLEAIDGILQLTKKTRSPDSRVEYVEEISKNIMQLKSSGSMFGYSSITQIADTVLNFLEVNEHINADLYKIIEAHNAAVLVIINNKLRGAERKEIGSITKELYDAISRYNKKYNSQE